LILTTAVTRTSFADDRLQDYGMLRGQMYESDVAKFIIIITIIIDYFAQDSKIN